jgi:putative YhdH/YhfP family quinone oxidoreductase
MHTRPFEALVVRETADGQFVRAVETRDVDDLPPGDLLVRVHYSTLNYKDALSATGNKGVTRRYPHTPGIDAAGAVESSDDPSWSAGDEVIVTGRDLGMNTSGGFGQYIRIPADWAIKRPDTLSLKECITHGTAGYTAAYGLMRLEENGITPERGEVLVTGATGAVGCLAVAILATAGYSVIAATGKPDAAEFLYGLGAAKVIRRDEVEPPPNRGLAKSRWVAAIDTVGGSMLDAAVRCADQHGAVACCGMIGSLEVSTSIFPFILRGVALLGIDSAESAMDRRHEIWRRLAGPWKVPDLERVVTECDLDQLDDKIDRMLAGQSRGKVRVRLG